MFLVRFLQGFVGTRDQGCVSPLIGEGKPRHPSHLRKTLTCFYLLLFVAMLVRVMSLSVTVIALPLHAYRIDAMLRCCYAILIYVTAMPCHACSCYHYAIPCSCLTRLHL